MGLKGYRLWAMGQLDSTCRAPPRTAPRAATLPLRFAPLPYAPRHGVEAHPAAEGARQHRLHHRSLSRRAQQRGVAVQVAFEAAKFETEFSLHGFKG
jgi:hypothetical protein